MVLFVRRGIVESQRDVGSTIVQSFYHRQHYLKVQFEKKKSWSLSLIPIFKLQYWYFVFLLIIRNYEQIQHRPVSLLFSLILGKARLLRSQKKKICVTLFLKPTIRKISYILSCLCHEGRCYRASPKEFKSLVNAVRYETHYVSVAAETWLRWRVLDIICLCDTQTAS